MRQLKKALCIRNAAFTAKASFKDTADLFESFFIRLLLRSDSSTLMEKQLAKKGLIVIRAKFMQHNGKRILAVDLSHCDLDDLVLAVKETKKLISQEPLETVLSLVDVRGTNPSSSIVRVMKELAVFNKPFVRVGAIVGIDKSKLVDYALILKFSGRSFTLFDEPEEAKNWLAQQ
jgi:hypothetical protein